MRTAFPFFCTLVALGSLLGCRASPTYQCDTIDTRYLVWECDNGSRVLEIHSQGFFWASGVEESPCGEFTSTELDMIEQGPQCFNEAGQCYYGAECFYENADAL